MKKSFITLRPGHHSPQHSNILSRNFLSCRGSILNFSKHNRSVVTNRKTSVKHIPPYTPILNSKPECTGLNPFFHIIATKHRLWVLIRTTLPQQFKSVPTIYVSSKYNKIISKIHHCILFGSVYVMNYNKGYISEHQYSSMYLTWRCSNKHPL